MQASLAPTRFLDFETESVRNLALAATAGASSPVERAVRLFYAVRDGIRYDYKAVGTDPEMLVASNVLAAGRSFCIGKAVVLAAACRAVGVPCRLGFADVRNHLAPEGLTSIMGTDVFVYHGYVSMWLGERWVKATPAFDIHLCERFGVKPIEFDGSEDALFHAYDARGELHMEYVRTRGEFDDLPHADMLRAFREAYPTIFDPDRSRQA